MKILILYYSSYGHVETLAYNVAQGAETIEGCKVCVKRVPETMTKDQAEAAGVRLNQKAPVADPQELKDYDAIIFGTPTRFGNMAGQMRTFLDQTGSLWAKGQLIGKVGSVFTSTGTGGGNETTITSFHSTLFHHGMLVVGLPYNIKELTDLSEVLGGSPYGASTLAGSDGSREVHEKEMKMAQHQGRYVAQITQKMLK